jgi:hypothetical protein
MLTTLAIAFTVCPCLYRLSVATHPFVRPFTILVGIAQDCPHFHPTIDCFVSRRSHCRHLLQPDGTSPFGNDKLVGNQSVRMASKKAPAPAEGGHMPFRKAGPETERLQQLMEDKGIMYNEVTAATVIAEDPWFGTFKPNSLKANITAMKKVFNMRENVEGMRTFLLVVASYLTILTTGAVKGGDNDDDLDIFDDKKVAAVAWAPPVVLAAAKRAAAASVPTITPAKKPTPETKFMVSGVVTQALYTDDESRDRLVLVVTMPANVTDANQLTVIFCPASNGAKLIFGVPRGRLANNMDQLMKGIATMPGFRKIDAWSASRALENTLKCRRVCIDKVIIDNYSITLDKAVDPSKIPDLHVFKSNDDGDTVCIIALDVPANNDYGKRTTDRVAKYI